MGVSPSFMYMWDDDEENDAHEEPPPRDPIFDKFSTIEAYPSNFNESEFVKVLEDYDHAEFYDDTKTYTKEPFVESFIPEKPRTYKYKAIFRGNLRYVVAVQVWTDEELQLIAQYCQCGVCNLPWYNLNSWSCRHCVGCLHSGSSGAQEHVIKRTLEYIRDRAHKLQILLNK